VVSEAIGHSLDDLDLVVDPLKKTRVQWPMTVGEHARQSTPE
jgi:hypothetical protein